MSTLSTTNLKNPSSGSNNIVLAADGSATITTLTGTTITGTSVRGGITSGTAVASTSGTSIDFTGIPSYVKRITVMFSGVSTSGTSNYQVQLGAGSITTSGYLSANTILNSAGSNLVTATSGIIVFQPAAAADTCIGSLVLTLFSSNTWIGAGVANRTNSGATVQMAGSLALGSTLDRLRITTVNGTDTFDAGSINIAYEG